MADVDSSLPGVIVVAEPVIHELLATQPISWRIQDRQENVARMWEHLSSGELDSYSRIVVFSDSLREGEADDADELTQTAWATAAMAGAGARVFVAVWRPERVEDLDRLIVDAAAAQGLDASTLDYQPLPAAGTARDVLDALRELLGSAVRFPDEWVGDVDVPLRPRPAAPSGLPLAPPSRTAPIPGLPLAPPTRPASPLDAQPEAAPAHAEPEHAEPEPAFEPGPTAYDEPDVQPEDDVRPEQDVQPEPDVVVDVQPEPAADGDVAPPADEVADATSGWVSDADAQVEAEDRADGPAEPVEPAVEPVGPLSPAAEPAGVERGVIAEEGWLRPGLPPFEQAPVVATAWSPDYPPQASQELLDRPVVDGQVTLTVVSSKGGSGKTTVSVLLAATIVRASARAGRPLTAVVVDLDTYNGQVSSLVGTFMPTALNIRVQPTWDEDAIRHNLVFAPGLGVETLLAPIRPRTADILGPDFYRTMIRSLKRLYDVVIIDTGNHYLAPLVADVALAESDEVLFVTTLAATAVQGMARALHELTASPAEAGLGVPRERVGIVVNQAATEVGLDGDALVTAGLGVPIVGVVPLATKDVLTATNNARMEVLLDHPLVGPAYVELARACLPSRALAQWEGPAGAGAPANDEPTLEDAGSGGGERRGLFRR